MNYDFFLLFDFDLDRFVVTQQLGLAHRERPEQRVVDRETQREQSRQDEQTAFDFGCHVRP